MTTRVALPPGIYRILNGDNAITSPTDQGAALITQPRHPANLAQQWQITGNGRCTPLAPNALRTYAWVMTPSVDQTDVSRSNHTYDWIINVVSNQDGTFTGWIMTSGGERLFWRETNHIVGLGSGVTVEWTFQPVA